MTRYVVAVVLAAAIAASGQVSLGVNLQNHVDYDVVEQPNDTARKASNFSISAGPILKVMLTEKTELSPYLGIRYTHTWHKQGANEGSENEAGMFLGCGLFFHLLRNEFMSLSTGPNVGVDFWFSHTAWSAGVGLPLNLDFIFNSAWSIRVSDEVGWIGYTRIKNGQRDEGYFDWDLQSFLSPSFTLFYTF